jgi:hypothetical protein
MAAAIDSLETAIHLDLMRARTELAEARLRQRQKDSPSNRAALATCLARMDTALDTYLGAKDLRR